VRYSIFRAVLLLILLVASSMSVTFLVHNGFTGTFSGSSPKVMLLAADTNSTNSSSINLSGVWQDAENTNITYNVQETCTSGSSCEVLATYATDPDCSSAVGTTFLTRTPISGNPLFVGNDTMLRCTPADNPIVENCSQNQIWDTTFNATFTNSSITGEYIDQYWTWNTTSNDLITDCRMEYTFANTFTLTRVPSNSTSFPPIVSSTQSQNPGPPNSGSGGQGSSSSKSSNSSTTSNSTSTTTTGSGGRSVALIYVAVAAGILVVMIGIGIIVLRKNP